MKFAGNDARNSASGCNVRASFGLNPIATPIGVHTTVANASNTITRKSVNEPSSTTRPTSARPTSASTKCARTKTSPAKTIAIATP